MDELFTEIRRRLADNPGKAINLPGVTLREAAVLVPLFVRRQIPYILFTRRPETLRTHAGQIAFPGGTRDPEDPTPLHTALREAHEELGIPPERVEVLGMLDESPTLTSFRIAPFVGAIPPDLAYLPSALEIDEVIEVPLAHLREPAFPRVELHHFAGRPHEVYFYEYGRHVIWGATAYIVRNFLELISDIPVPSPHHTS